MSSPRDFQTDEDEVDPFDLAIKKSGCALFHYRLQVRILRWSIAVTTWPRLLPGLHGRASRLEKMSNRSQSLSAVHQRAEEGLEQMKLASFFS